MQNSGKAIIVIPLYKTDLPEVELMSLKRTVEVLGQHPFAIICPDNLDIAPLSEILKPVNYRVERFKDHYFDRIAGYNSLMLAEEFYQRFTDHEYILICQTDVFVFRDELLYWCGKGYDYIGAPWIASPDTVLKKLFSIFKNIFGKKKEKNHHHFKVGNGGFSLRKVSMMLHIIHDRAINNHQPIRMEDIYFSIIAPKYIPEIKIPGYLEAINFCIDRKPDVAMKINKKQIPFACHGFYKPKVKNFWKPIIAKFRAES